MKNKTICYYDFEATSVSRDSDPISLGIIAVQNNKVLKSIYCEFNNFNIDKCDDWVKDNIVSKLGNENKNCFEQLSLYKVDNQKDYCYSNDDNAIHFQMEGDTNGISRKLKQWLSQFESIEFWADFDVIDKPMLIDLIADWDVKKDYTLHNKVYEECKGVIEKIAYHNSDKTLVEDFVSFYPSKTEFIKYNKIGLPKHLPNIRYDQFFDLHTLLKLKGIDTDISRVEFIGDLIKEIPEGQSHNSLYDSYVNWKVHQKLMSI